MWTCQDMDYVIAAEDSGAGCVRNREAQLYKLESENTHTGHLILGTMLQQYPCCDHVDL